MADCSILNIEMTFQSSVPDQEQREADSVR